MAIIKAEVKKIAVVGAGGLGQEVFCIWRDMLNAQNIEYDFVGFFDDNPNIKDNHFGEVVGNIDSLNNINYELEIAIAIGNSKILQLIKSKIDNPLIIFPNVIHPSVKFLDSNSTKITEGNILSLDVVISCNCIIGSFNIFNTRVNIGHDSNIGHFNIFSPNSQIMGNVIIQDQNFFGFSCGVIQGKKIGSRNTVGAGGILLRTIKNDGTYIGVPAVKVKLT